VNRCLGHVGGTAGEDEVPPGRNCLAGKPPKLARQHRPNLANGGRQGVAAGQRLVLQKTAWVRTTSTNRSLLRSCRGGP
jgi:hypothetical protein